MEACIVNPERRRGEPLLPKTGLIAVNPSDKSCITDYARQEGLKRHFLFNSTLYSSPSLFLAGPSVGAPMAVLTIEKLIALGAQRIILYGWCGSIQKNIHAMDLLVPTEAVSEEGTSGHYLLGNMPHYSPSASLRTRLCAYLKKRGLSFHEGSLWTTDAPYRETEHKVHSYSTNNICGVDMEYAALCAVAAFRKVDFASVMLVSDELLTKPWTPSYTFKTFKQKSEQMFKVILDFISIQDPVNR